MEKVIRSLSIIRFKIIRVTFSVSFLCLLELLLQEQDDFLAEAMLNTMLIALRWTFISALEYEIFRRIENEVHGI